MAAALTEKIEHEQQVVAQMIAIYCRGRHKTRQGLCEQCAELAAYARQRTENCPRMQQKTFCSICPVHCYTPVMREKIREVMRYAGPRMIWRRPLLALRHLLAMRREKSILEKNNGIKQYDK